MKSLYVLGDSILKGVMYSETDGKYRLCRDTRFCEIESEGIAVNNKSKMGATVDRANILINTNSANLSEDTAILFEYGGNDCDYNWSEISSNPSGSFLPRTPKKDFIEKYEKAVQNAQKSGARVIISSLIPIDAAKYMKTITKHLSYKNILSWLGDVSMLYRWQEQYNRTVESIAARMGCELLDLRGAFLESHDYDNLIGDDGIHPTQQGHDLIRKTIKEYILATKIV